MSSDFKGLVKSCKVKGNKKALSLVVFRARPRRLESLTWKDSARKTKRNFPTVLIPSSLLRRIIFSGNGRPRNETSKRGLKVKVIIWHAFKTEDPRELHKSDYTVNSPLRVLRDHRNENG